MKSYLARYLVNYCELSSIQGLNHLVRAKSFVERFWWVIVLFSCIAGCSFMTYQVFDKWITSPVLVTLSTHEVPIHQIPFPAVTICPETKISYRCLNYSKVLQAKVQGNLEEISADERWFFDQMTPFCKSTNHDQKIGGQHSYIKFGDENIYDDYISFLQHCKSVSISLGYCQWMGADIECDEIFTPIVTDEGLCYSFNMYKLTDLYKDNNETNGNNQWSIDEGYDDDSDRSDFPRRSYLIGAKNALVVVIFTNKSEIHYSCTDFSTQGMRVAIHSPTSIPRPSQVFFSVGLDRLTNFAVTPKMMRTTDGVRYYPPNRRNCYFSSERNLKYFKKYSQTSCNLECLTNFTLEHCGCANFYMPRDPTTEVCGLKEQQCLENIKGLYSTKILRESLRLQKERTQPTDCQCLPTCNDLSYNAEISTAEWHFADLDETILDDEEMRDHFSKLYASAAKIYFKNQYFLPTEKSELYGTTALISNIGGLLGLFTGFSLFSVAEFVYFLSVRMIENYRRYGSWAGPSLE